MYVESLTVFTGNLVVADYTGVDWHIYLCSHFGLIAEMLTEFNSDAVCNSLVISV